MKEFGGFDVAARPIAELLYQKYGRIRLYHIVNWAVDEKQEPRDWPSPENSYYANFDHVVRLNVIPNKVHGSNRLLHRTHLRTVNTAINERRPVPKGKDLFSILAILVAKRKIQRLDKLWYDMHRIDADYQTTADGARDLKALSVTPVVQLDLNAADGHGLFDTNFVKTITDDGITPQNVHALASIARLIAARINNMKAWFFSHSMDY